MGAYRFNMTMKKTLNYFLTIILLIMLSASLFACTAKKEEERKILLLDNGTIRSTYRLAKGKSNGGTDVHTGLTVNIASNKPIKYVNLTGFDSIEGDAKGGYYPYLSLSEYEPEAQESYNGYYFYSLEVDIQDYKSADAVADHYFEYNNLHLNIDGEEYVYHITYAIGYYENERPFVSYDNMSTSSKDGTAACGFKATENIEVISIRTRGDAIVSDQEKNAGLFADLPKVLNKDDEYNFSFNWKLKNGVEYGEDYFIVEYKRQGNDTIYYSPFGFMAVDDTRNWKNRIEVA